MPIETPRLLIRSKQPGDGGTTSAAVIETWAELNRWMRWAENPADFTPEAMEVRCRRVMASFILRESVELIGIEKQTRTAVVWCGLHEVDWDGSQCDTGFWVRKSSQGLGFATEACNALVRYAFGALGMRRVGITHSEGNEASRRVVEKLGFAFEGKQRGANFLSGGRRADRCCYSRLDTVGLPELEVHW